MQEKSANIAKINSITFSRLVNTGNYENERFEVCISPTNDEITSRALFNAAYLVIDAAVRDRFDKGTERKVR